MLKKLINNLRIDSQGQVEVPHQLIKEYFSFNGLRIPFIFNFRRDKIALNLNVTPEKLLSYTKSVKARNRQLISYKNVNNLSILFNLNSSRRLFNYKNVRFNLLYDSDKNYLIFSFLDLNFSCELVAKIKNSVLFVHRLFPPEFVNLMELNKEYVILKLYNLISFHKKKSLCNYDLLVTFDKSLVKLVNLSDKRYDRNLYVKEYKYDKRKIFLSRSFFKEFLKGKEILHFLIYHKSNEKRQIYFRLDLSSFEKYLLDHFLVKRQLKKFKNNQLQKRLIYSTYILDYLKSFRPKLKINSEWVPFNSVDLSEFDFSSSKYRITHDIPVKIIFTSNGFLMSKNLDLSLASNFDVLKNELKAVWHQGYSLFTSTYSKELSNRELSLLNDNEIKTIESFLTQLRIISQLCFSKEFAKDVFYSYSVLKKNLKLITVRFKKKQLFVYNPLLTSASVYYVLLNHFPSYVLNKAENYLFYESFVNFQFSAQDVFNFFYITKDLLYLYEASEDLKYFGNTFKSIFGDNIFLNQALTICYEIVRILYKSIAISGAHNELAIVSFLLVIIALGLRNKVSIRQICSEKFVKGRQPSLTSKVFRFVSNNESKNLSYFEKNNVRKLKISDPDVVDRVRWAIVREILDYYYAEIYKCFKAKDYFLDVNSLLNRFFSILEYFINFNLISKEQLLKLENIINVKNIVLKKINLLNRKNYDWFFAFFKV